MRVVREAGRAAIAIVSRDGDPSPAVAAFVSTSGIGGARGALVPVALAGLFESRAHVRATPQADGVRISIETRDAREAIARIANALGEPVTSATDTSTARRKVLGLAALPRVVGDATAIATCEGTLVPPADSSMPTNDELEAWRAASVVRERVAFAVVGTNAPSAPPLTSANAAVEEPRASALGVYDATGDVPNGSSIVSIAWRGDLRALGASRDLERVVAPMIAATDVSARVRSVKTALSARGACLSLRVELASSNVERIADVATVAKRELAAAVANASADVAWSTNALDAAEQAAIVALAGARPAREAEASVVVGGDATTDPSAIARAMDDAEKSWSVRVVESRAAVERGQPATWVLVGSPCGVAGEGPEDAGASAAFATAAAATARARGANADAWIASDGIGIIASANDPSTLADIVARAFVLDALEDVHAAHGRLLASARAPLSALAEAIAPSAPAFVLPGGTGGALLRLSDASIASRADALRRGPLRVAVLSSDDAAHASAIAQRVDRFVARGVARACPARASRVAPKPGTYAVTTDDGTSEVYVAAMVPADAEDDATAIAAVLDGDGGLLDGALGDGVTRERSARVLGPPGGRAIVVHAAAPALALDAAVAQLRALFDRMRQGAITGDDLARAKKRSDDAHAITMRDPRVRIVALFRDAHAAPFPTLEHVRAAASAILHDDALVIVAARPRGAQTKRTP